MNRWQPLVWMASNLFYPSAVFASADVIFHGGRIMTMDAAKPEVEAVAVKDGKIVAMGSLPALKEEIGPKTRLEDLAGKTLLPGFSEGHGHMLGLGRKAVELDLSGVKSLDDVLVKIAARAKELKDGEWLTGRGWDQNLWPTKTFPTKEDLAQAAPRNPVFLSRVDGHAAWVNAQALQLAGIDARTTDPAGGRILRAKDGEPIGILVDGATGLVERVMPPLSAQQINQALDAGIQAALAAGVTTFHDAGVAGNVLRVYEKRAQAGQLPLRLYAMASGDEPSLVTEALARGPVNIRDRYMLRSIKLMVDGALGSRGAALLEDYADEPGNRGLLIRGEDEVYRVTKRALAAGFQVASHAIGDQANRIVLNAYEKALAASPKTTDARLRVEHAQIVAPADVERFAKLGVIASMQAIHCPSDSPWAITRLGEERFRNEAYVWRTFLEQDVHLAAGSDAPVEPIAPLWGMHAFLTRANAEGEPRGGWNPEQKLTLDESLAAYTREGAYAAFLEDRTGKLATGFYADLVILEGDVRAKTPLEIRNTRVLQTLVEGRVVFEQGESKSSRTARAPLLIDDQAGTASKEKVGPRPL